MKTSRKTARRIVILIVALVLVVALTMTSGCAVGGKNLEGAITLKVGEVNATTSNFRRQNEKGATVSLTNPFAEKNANGGGVENIMD